MKKLLLFLLVLSVNSGFATDYYVDFDKGSDSNGGTSKTSAWKHAPGDVNASGNANVSLSPGDKVIFKGGVVYRGSIVFKSSGTESSSIKYIGNVWGESLAVMDGSETVTGFTDTGNGIYKASLSLSDNLASVYQGDKFCYLSQYPQQPDPFWYDDIKFFTEVPIGDLTDETVTDASFFTNTDPNYYDGAYIAAWMNPNWVKIQKITSYDVNTNTITFEKCALQPYTDKPGKYALLNHKDFLTAKGDYYINGGEIFIKVLSTDFNAKPISVGTRKVAFDLNAKSNIEIDGFRIQKYYGAQIYEGVGVLCSNPVSANLEVRNNELRLLKSLEGYGTIHMVAQKYTVANNNIHDNYKSSGIRVGGSDILVKDNVIRKIGRAGIYMQDVEYGQVIGNKLDDINGTHGNAFTFYLANHDILIANNTITNSRSTFTMHGTWGLHTDYSIYVIGNVFVQNVHENSKYGTYMSWGKDIEGVRIFNNLFIGGSADDYGLSLTEKDKDFTLVNNVFKGAMINKGKIASGSYPGLTINNNIYTHKTWLMGDSYGWYYHPGEIYQDDLSKLFVDESKGDYRPFPGSELMTGANVLNLLPTELFPNFDFFTDIDGIARPKDKEWTVGPHQYDTAVWGDYHVPVWAENFPSTFNVKESTPFSIKISDYLSDESTVFDDMVFTITINDIESLDYSWSGDILTFSTTSTIYQKSGTVSIKATNESSGSATQLCDVSIVPMYIPPTTVDINSNGLSGWVLSDGTVGESANSNTGTVGLVSKGVWGFDLSSIPNGNVITDASFTNHLDGDRGSSTTYIIDLHGINGNRDNAHLLSGDFNDENSTLLEDNYFTHTEGDIANFPFEDKVLASDAELIAFLNIALQNKENGDGSYVFIRTQTQVTKPGYTFLYLNNISKLSLTYGISTVQVTDVSLDKTSTSLVEDDTEQLSATVNPSDASNKNVTWSSSNESVATVSTTGLVTAIAVGKATITVTTVDGSFQSTCEIDVSHNLSLEFSSSNVKVYPNPTSNNLHVSFDNSNSKNIRVVLINMLGVTVFQERSNQNKFDIDCSKYPKGVYILKLKDGETELVKKVEIN